MTQRHAAWMLYAVALCTIGAAALGPAAAQSTSPAETFRRLNDTNSAIYQATKRRYLAAQDPVVIVGFNSIVIRYHGTVRQVGQIPEEYNILKAVGHTPRSLWAALAPAIADLDPEQTWRKQITEQRQNAVAALAVLPQTGLPAEIIARDAKMLQGCIALIDGYLANGLPSDAQLQSDTRAFTPTILADAASAATAQIDAADRDVRPWWNSLTQAERERTYVLVLGGKMARIGNVAYSYFLNLLGHAQDGYHLVYAESIYDDAGADALLSTLVTDRRLSIDFFADERRMERDVMADGAEARLLVLFGRLGTP